MAIFFSSRVIYLKTSYLDVLRHAGSKRAKGWGMREEYPECFPDVVKLLFNTILQSDWAYTKMHDR